MPTKNSKLFVDAPADLDFKVSSRAIAEGEPGNATACIFAKALREKHKDIVYAEVRPNAARVIFADGRHYYYMVPRELRLGLKALDAFGAAIVEPGTYSLLKPEGVRSIAFRRKAVAEHAARKAAGTATPYKPRARGNDRKVAKMEGVRSSVWGTMPTVRPFESRLPHAAQHASGNTTGEPGKQSF